MTDRMNHKAGSIKSAMLLMGILVLTACGNSGAGTVEKSVSMDVQAAEMSTSGNVNETSNNAVSSENTGITAGNEKNTAESVKNEEHHILVAFFSEAGEQYRVGTIEKGNTQIVAEMIAQKTGADLFHIERKTAYPKTYNDLLQVAQDEQKKTARPELSASVENWNDYDTVFIGYPIWWGDMPMPVYTFLENHDFTGKTVIPFDTNEGSGLAGTVQSVKNSCTGAIVKEGLAIEGKTAQKDPEKTEQAVNEWLNKNGFSTMKAESTIEKSVTAEASVKEDSLVTNGGYTVDCASLAHRSDSAASKVYYTSDISSDALMKIYSALGRTPSGKTAVKLSTGEAGDTYYLDPQMIKPLVQSVNGTIVECNTAYGGSRSSTDEHMEVAKDHGFTDIANVDIMDADGSLNIPVTGGKHLTEDMVGKDLANYDFVMVLSHFKGHAMGGFGGALKNISIGIGSRAGKMLIHSAGKTSKSFSMFTDQDAFTESMAEAAKAVSDYENHGSKMLYISVMNHLSVDCDCDSSPAEPTMKDVGVLASTDPVALDQACVDLVYAVPGGKDLIARMESRKGVHILEHAEEIGLGNRSYSLENIGTGINN